MTGTPALLSFSQAETWHECPRQHFYKYRTDMEFETGPEAAVGGLVHGALEVMGRFPPAERTAAQAWDVVRALAPAGAAWGADPDLQRRAWVHLMSALDMPEVVEAEVLAAEVKFETVLDGIPFRGAIDAVVVGHRGTKVRDYKDGSGKWRHLADDRKRKRHQVIGYAAAWAQVTGETRPRDAEVVWTAIGAVDHWPVTDLKVGQTLEWLHKAHDGIAVTAEAPSPDQVEARPGDLCSWCPAVGQCPEGLEAAWLRARNPDKSMGEPGLAALAALEDPAA